jgi:uncharacterized protein (TIGR03067 family)
MRKSLFFLVPAVLALAFAPAPFPRPSKQRGDTNESDLKKLQGAWTRVQLGIGVPPGVDNCAVTITGTRMQFPSPDDAWTLTLQATRKPKLIDAARVNAQKDVFRGIYRFEGGTLIICWRHNGDRPTNFTAGVQGVWYQVYKRKP